jgi:DNA polymerase III alpha subunit
MYPTPKDKITHELAMAIKDNMTIYDPNHRVLTTENHMMVEDEIRTICKNNGYSEEQINNWINETETIADRCNANIEM